ncbi:MAG: hypothetical protein G01um10145_518 [Microgenomates group bacterium Gr01-1014_5]|nr:MAG: hypothetical protein G01um10145_518 [Microgenomates group bacterium Gr01-1014_5]
MSSERSPRILPQEAVLLGEKIPASILSVGWIETATVDLADKLHQAAIFGGMLARGIKITSDSGKIFLGEPGNPNRQIIIDNLTDSTNEFTAECYALGIKAKDPKSIKVHSLLSGVYVRISTRNHEQPLKEGIQIKFFENNDTEVIVEILDKVWYATFVKKAGNLSQRLSFSSGLSNEEKPLMAIIQNVVERDIFESPMIELWNKVDTYLIETLPDYQTSKERFVIAGEPVLRAISKICHKLDTNVDIKDVIDLAGIIKLVDNADDFLCLFIDKLAEKFGTVFKNPATGYAFLAKEKTRQVPKALGIASAIFIVGINKLIPVIPFKFTFSNSEFVGNRFTEEEQKIWVNFIGKYVRRNLMPLNQVIKNLKEIVGNNKRALNYFLKKGVEFTQEEDDED